MTLRSRPLVFVDIETTGAAPYSSRMLEIGALRMEGGKIVDNVNQLLDPEGNVPPFITSLTGIQPHETKGMPRFADLRERLAEIFDGAIFVAHNVNFDYGFFVAEFRRLDIGFAMDRFCTVRLSRALYPAERSHRLDEVIRRGGYEVDKRHRAFDDALVLHKFHRDSRLQFGDDAFFAKAERLLQPAPSNSFM